MGDLWNFEDTARIDIRVRPVRVRRGGYIHGDVHEWLGWSWFVLENNIVCAMGLCTKA